MKISPEEIRIATAGEALIDLVTQPDGSLLPCLGGAVYNLTRALSRQGVGVAYLNPLSGDRFGRSLRTELMADGVHCARQAPVKEPTSLAVVALDDQGKPDYAFYRDGVADRAITAVDMIADTHEFQRLGMVCTGCLALAPQDRERYLPWLQACRDADRTVVIDANLRPSVMSDLDRYRHSVREYLTLADVIKASDDDLVVLLGAVSDPLAAARSLFAVSPAKLIALTLGAQGAFLLARDGRTWQAKDHAPIEIVDTVGAGDCFLAGLLTALVGAEQMAIKNIGALPDGDAKVILSQAVASASLCVEQRGCVPPSLDAVRMRVAQDNIRAVSR